MILFFFLFVRHRREVPKCVVTFSWFVKRFWVEADRDPERPKDHKSTPKKLSTICRSIWRIIASSAPDSVLHTSAT
jgi:hypothetical protein